MNSMPPWRELLSRWFNSGPNRRQPERKSRCRPCLEGLEQRVAPAASLLTDINARPTNPESSPSNLVAVNGAVFFSAAVGGVSTNVELWKSDGTSTGTVLVKDINVGSPGSFPRYLTNVNGT